MHARLDLRGLELGERSFRHCDRNIFFAQCKLRSIHSCLHHSIADGSPALRFARLAVGLHCFASYPRSEFDGN